MAITGVHVFVDCRFAHSLYDCTKAHKMHSPTKIFQCVSLAFRVMMQDPLDPIPRTTLSPSLHLSLRHDRSTFVSFMQCTVSILSLNSYVSSISRHLAACVLSAIALAPKPDLISCFYCSTNPIPMQRKRPWPPSATESNQIWSSLSSPWCGKGSAPLQHAASGLAAWRPSSLTSCPHKTQRRLSILLGFIYRSLHLSEEHT